MSLATLLAQTATVTPRVPDDEDEYGDVTLAFGTPVDYPCRLEQFHTQGGATEENDGQARAITSFSLYLPATAAIDYLDQVTVDGIDYEVDGAPEVQRSPAGPHHVVATLRHIQGG